MNLVSGLFMHLDDAKRAVYGLTQLGISNQQIKLIFDENQDYACHWANSFHRMANATEARSDRAKCELATTLQVQGMPADEADLYAEAVLLGGALVTVQLMAPEFIELENDLVCDTLANARAINLDFEQTAFRAS